MTSIEYRVLDALSNGPLTTAELKREVTSLQNKRIDNMHTSGLIALRDEKWHRVIGEHIDTQETLAMLRRAADIARKAGVKRGMFTAFAQLVY